MQPIVTTFFDPVTFTATYVVTDPATRRCAVIDGVLDYDAASGKTDTKSAERVLAYINAEGLTVDIILDTHVHADHLSGMQILKDRLGAPTGIGADVPKVQRTFASILNIENKLKTDGSQFDKLFDDGEHFAVGEINSYVIATPGHTPACVTYVIGDAAFVGDMIFMPDFGSARCDFPGGDARTLFQSIEKVLSLPPETRVFTGHDYKAPGRDEYKFESTIELQKKNNIHVGGGKSESEFVAMREERDSKLGAPKLLWPAVQVNIRAGALPTAEENGRQFIKIPLNAF